jgi:hypothetical protein
VLESGAAGNGVAPAAAFDSLQQVPHQPVIPAVDEERRGELLPRVATEEVEGALALAEEPLNKFVGRTGRGSDSGLLLFRIHGHESAGLFRCGLSRLRDPTDSGLRDKNSGPRVHLISPVFVAGVTAKRLGVRFAVGAMVGARAGGERCASSEPARFLK